MVDEPCVDCPEHLETRAVDNSAWDGPAAMSKCANSDTPASCYNAICAGKKAGDPNLQSSHALPHHKAPGDPPNAAGVRNALARLPQTQGLTNAGAARSHLEAHMASIQSQSNSLVHREDGTLEVRMSTADWEVRHSGRPDEAFTVRGYPIRYNAMSLDLGGFRETIAPGAFDDVLSSDPHVVFAWDHDTRYVGASTTSGTLHLSSDEMGVLMDAQVGNYTWAKDLRTALERRDITQGSFSFKVANGGDDWEINEDESVTRIVRKVGSLFDVTVTAQGAYPQTSLVAVRSLLESARKQGRLPQEGAVLVAERGGPESPKGSEADEEFTIRFDLLKKRAARRKETLAKLSERMTKLHG